MLGTALIIAGLGHLTFSRTDFQAQVPDWVGIDKNAVVILSGVVEIVLGSALIAVRRRRRLLGLAAGLFFIAVFAGNLSQFIDGDDAFGLNSDTARRNRLFFQPVLVAWAWWSTEAFALLRHGRRSRQPGSQTHSVHSAVLTRRLLIRPVVPSDADAYAALMDDTVIRISGFPEHYQRDVRLTVELGMTVGMRVLANLSDRRIVGMIQTYTQDQLVHDRCELGFYVGSDDRGNGFATEALEGFVDHLHTCGYKTVEASTAVDNVVVGRLLTRVGFVAVEEYRRTLPNGTEIDGVRFEHKRAAGEAQARTDPGSLIY